MSKTHKFHITAHTIYYTHNDKKNVQHVHLVKILNHTLIFLKVVLEMIRIFGAGSPNNFLFRVFFTSPQ